MILEFHMLKNYPPVNLNRDDSGAPKTCFFGGVQRGRISSQCLKRSWRASQGFEALGSFGIRTRYMPELVAKKLREMGVGEEYLPIAEKMLTGVANKDGKENSKGNYTAQIVIYSPEDIEALALQVKAEIEESGSPSKFKAVKAKEFVKRIADAKARPITADIALFGRMVTSDGFADVEAAMQVAHAISTHAVNRESDYYTAVDDLLAERDELGAGMMGDTDFNSCCYYEYAALDVDQLRENLSVTPDGAELADKLVPVLMKVMAFTNPSGKQNSFAGHVLPSLIMVECKDEKIPLSYAGAFETPVSGIGVVQNSIKQLFSEVDLMDEAYALKIAHRCWMAPKAGVAPKMGQRVARFDELTEQVSGWLKEDRM